MDEVGLMMFSADPIWGREKSCSILGINCTNWCTNALSSPSPPAAKTISDVLIDNLRWTSCFWWSQIGRWVSCRDCREERWLRPHCGASSPVWQDTLHLLVPERMMTAVTSLCGALWAFRERSVWMHYQNYYYPRLCVDWLVFMRDATSGFSTELQNGLGRD